MPLLKKTFLVICTLGTTLLLSGQVSLLQDACEGKKEEACEQSLDCAWKTVRNREAGKEEGFCDVSLKHKLDTPESISKFQEKYGLKITGKLDEKTLEKIDELEKLKIK